MMAGITNLLLSQRDCLQFFLGLSFVYLAAVTFTLYQERGKQEKFPWQWLGFFAFGQIAFQWLTMFFALFPWGGLWELLRALTLFFSYLSLGFFVSGYLKNGQEQRRWWRLWPLSIIFVVGALSGGWEVFYVVTRYLFGLPVGVIAASALYHEGENEVSGSARQLKIAGSGLLVFVLLLIMEVVPGSFFPVAWLNYQVFANFFIFPVQFFQMAGVVVLTGALWNYLDLRQRSSAVIKPANLSIRQAMVWLMALILVGGFLLTFVLANYSRGLLLRENYAYLRAIAQNLQDEFGDSDGIARSLSGSPYIIDALARKDRRSLALANSALDRYQRSFNKGVCYLLDSAGVTIASSNRAMPDSFVGNSYAFRPYFQKAVQGELGRFIGRGKTSGVFGYYAAYPVYVAGQVKGVVAVKVELDRQILGEDHYLALLGVDSEILVPSEDFLSLTRQSEGRWGAPPPSLPAYLYQGRRFSSLERPVAEGEWKLTLIYSDELVSYFKLFARVVTLLFVLMFMTGNYFIRKLELIGLRIAEDEKRYRALFEKSVEGIFLLDIKDAQIIEANQAGARMHGCSVEEIKEHKMTDFDTPENKAKAPARLDLMEEGDWLGGEIDHLKIDGTPFPVEWQAGPVGISGQKYVLAFIRDISEKKKTQDLLRESKELLQTVISNLQGVVFSVDRQGIFLLSEGKALATLGLKPGEVVGRSVFEVYQEVPAVIEGMRLALSGQEWQGLARVQDVVFDTFVTPIFNEQKEVIGATGIATDITERQRAEEAAQHLSLAIEQSPVSVVITNKDGNITYVNPKFSEVTGYSYGEALGKNPRVLKSGEQSVDFYLQLWQTILSGQEWHGEFHNKKKNGELYWESASISPLFDQQGLITHFVAVKEDITERKEREFELKQKNSELERLYKVKSDFTSAVSHELRTPLTSIKEGIALVLDGAAGAINAQQNEFLGIAKRNVDRLHRLINDVLDFSKLEAGKMTFNLRRGQLEPLVREVVGTERVAAGQKKLPLLLEVERDLPEVLFDPDRIAQVLNNLLSNAIKFTEQGTITVRVHKDPINGGVKVGIADTGRGIAPDDLAKLFHEYQQVGGILERKAGGTGLGLVISKQIVEKHQGKVWAESVLGQGSTFWFTLPPAA